MDNWAFFEEKDGRWGMRYVEGDYEACSGGYATEEEARQYAPLFYRSFESKLKEKQAMKAKEQREPLNPLERLGYRSGSDAEI